MNGSVDPAAARAARSRPLAELLVEERFHRAPWISYRTAQARMRGMLWRPHALGALARVEFTLKGFDLGDGHDAPGGRGSLAFLAVRAMVTVEECVSALEDMAAVGGWLSWSAVTDTLTLTGQGPCPWHGATLCPGGGASLRRGAIVAGPGGSSPRAPGLTRRVRAGSGSGERPPARAWITSLGRMSAFDELAGTGGLLGLMGTAIQIPDMTLALYGALDVHDGDAMAAAREDGLLQAWTDAALETRACVLLSASWASRELRVDTTGVSGAAPGYAKDFHEYAADWDAADVEGFHGVRFPAMPLPGRAGKLATALGFDRDDVEISLRVALVLMAPAYRNSKPQG